MIAIQAKITTAVVIINLNAENVPVNAFATLLVVIAIAVMNVATIIYAEIILCVMGIV